MPCPFTKSLQRESAGLQKSASPTASDCCGADASICCEIVTSPGPVETTSDAACVARQGKLADAGMVTLSCVAVAAVTCADTPSIVTTFALGIVLKFWPVIVTLAPACSSVGEIAVTSGDCCARIAIVAVSAAGGSASRARATIRTTPPASGVTTPESETVATDASLVLQSMTCPTTLVG